GWHRQLQQVGVKLVAIDPGNFATTASMIVLRPVLVARLTVSTHTGMSADLTTTLHFVLPLGSAVTVKSRPPPAAQLPDALSVIVWDCCPTGGSSRKYPRGVPKGMRSASSTLCRSSPSLHGGTQRGLQWRRSNRSASAGGRSNP